jgi:hypothetical protein
MPRCAEWAMRAAAAWAAGGDPTEVLSPDDILQTDVDLFFCIVRRAQKKRPTTVYDVRRRCAGGRLSSATVAHGWAARGTAL